MRPAERKRSARSLSLSEREEISRGLVAGRSARAIAAKLGRPPSQRIAVKIRRAAVAEFEGSGNMMNAQVELCAIQPRQICEIEVTRSRRIRAGRRAGITLALANGALLADLQPASVDRSR